MARFEPNTLFHNRGDRFADITAAAGVGNPGKGHGVGFADYDLDAISTSIPRSAATTQATCGPTACTATRGTTTTFSAWI